MQIINKTQMNAIIKQLTDHPLRDGDALLDRCKAARKAGPGSPEWASLLAEEASELERQLEYLRRKAGK